MGARRCIYERILEPGTGKALPVLRGQVLRVEQLENGQCADFNAFNLQDYKEHFHAGRTRVIHGLWPAVGDVLWSAPPRERPMYTIVADTVGTNDVSYPRCTGVFYESQFGLARHTNCQDIQAEAQREYGLTPDDVHDSFNMWMHTGVDAAGRLYIKPQRARAGDYIELLAQIDTLAVVNVCGADVTWTSNFDLKPLRLQVFEGTPQEREQWERPAPRYRNQLQPGDFAVSAIKATRGLVRNPAYIAQWPVYPIERHAIVLTLSRDEHERLEALGRRQPGFGREAGEILRSVFFAWWLDNRVPP